MRRAFADSLIAAAQADPRVIFLTGDLGFGTFDEFAKRFGPRYVNTGVAEAQLVCAAAGLALEGWRPIIYSIGSFMVGRPFEQIRINISYANLPVVIVGAGGGYTYAACGVTHHAGEDLALMSLLPNLTVTAPGDPSEVAALLPQLLKLDGPSYIRVGKYGEPAYQAADPVVLGQARRIRDGSRVAVLSTGGMAPLVVSALETLEKEDIRPAAWQFHTVKPLDTAALDRLAGQVATLVVVEEHMPRGGLASGVQAWRAQRETGPRVLRLGPPDDLVLGNPKLPAMRSEYGYDAPAIAAQCRTWWKKSD